MKKLMIAVGAAALCGAVSYADVTSANIVGFQTTEMKNSIGYNFLIPTFTDVAAKEATYDLQNVKLVGAYGDGYTDSIEVWDETGSMTDENYWWCTAADWGCAEGEDGWFTMGGEERIADVKFPVGMGLYLNLQSDGATVQYAGQVYDGEVLSKPLAPGYNIVGNSTPVKITLQDLKLIGSYGDGYTDSIEVWDETGSMTDVNYWWCTAADWGCAEGEDGWFTMGGEERITDVDLQPGEGIFINIQTGDEVQFTVPNPLTYVYPTK